MKKRAKLLWLAIGLLAGLLIGFGIFTVNYFRAGSAAPMTEAAVDYSSNSMSAGGTMAKTRAYSAAATEDMAADNSGNGTGMDSVETPDTGDVDAVPSDRKLIRNLSLSFETAHFDDFVSALESEAASLGGYAEYSSVYRDSSTGMRTASYTYRIPRDKADEFVNSTSDQATVISRSENVQDITLNYHDIEARKTALQTEYDSLTRLMEQAQDVDTIIALSSRLSEIRYQLDAYESNLRTYDNQVDYTTVDMTVSETKVESATGETAVWDKIRIGFVKNLQAVGSFFAALAIGILTSLPAIAVTVVIILFIWWIVRKIRRRKNKGTQDKGKIIRESQAKPENDAGKDTEDPEKKETEDPEKK